MGRNGGPAGNQEGSGNLPLPHPPLGNTPVLAAHIPAAGLGTPLGLSVSKPQMTEFLVPKAALGLAAALLQSRDILSLQAVLASWGLGGGHIPGVGFQWALAACIHGC